MSALQWVGQILAVGGALIFVTAGLGLLRLRDVFARISAVGTAAGFGIGLVIVGAYLAQAEAAHWWQMVLAVLLQLVTSAVGSMAIARSAYLTGSRVAHACFDEVADLSGVPSPPCKT